MNKKLVRSSLNEVSREENRWADEEIDNYYKNKEVQKSNSQSKHKLYKDVYRYVEDVATEIYLELYVHIKGKMTEEDIIEIITGKTHKIDNDVYYYWEKDLEPSYAADILSMDILPLLHDDID